MFKMIVLSLAAVLATSTAALAEPHGPAAARGPRVIPRNQTLRLLSQSTGLPRRFIVVERADRTGVSLWRSYLHDRLQDQGTINRAVGIADQIRVSVSRD